MKQEDAYRVLANAIVIEAVKEWRRLCKRLKKGKPNVSFDELRGFFKSEWCALLCGRVDPLLILNKLEAERKDALTRI